jgi:LPS sulfotransferase NodH
MYSLMHNHRRTNKIQSPRWTSALATYVICTNPRSGSWLLGKGLAATGLAGDPREWFNPWEEQRHRARWRMDHATDLSFRAYIGIANAESTTPNGVSGIKLHYYQLAALSNKIAEIEGVSDEGLSGLTDARLMSELFPSAHYLWLTRRDRARQAISLHIALATREWRAGGGRAAGGTTRKSSAKIRAALAFDAEAIARTEAVLAHDDARWAAVFQAMGIAPFTIYYEDLAADYAGTIRSVLNWRGLADAESVDIAPSRLERQSDARSEEWLERYLAFKREGGRPSESPAPKHPSSDKTSRLLTDALQPSGDVLPHTWKQWVGHSKIMSTPDDVVVDVLVANGYGRELARAELERAASDPYLQGAVRTRRGRSRAIALLNAMGELARLDPRARVVERRTDLSREEFRDRYYAANRPVILQDLMTRWRVPSAWTPDYLKAVAGDGMVEIMADRNADPKCDRNPRKHRADILFADYVDRVFSGDVTNDYYMTAKNGFLQRPEAEPFLKDFSSFPEYLNPQTAARRCHLWFGPAGTVTPLHFETRNILFAQVSGRKRYRLVSAKQWQYVYNNIGVFSDVDCENPDLDRHPKFRDATVIDIVVEPGETLFMPVGWWHHVRALDVSMTISFTNFVFPNVFSWE